MTGYDAFGRRIGEDTLEGLRDAPPEPVEDAAADTAPTQDEPAVSVMGAGSPLATAEAETTPHEHVEVSMPEWAPGKRRFLGPLILLSVLIAVGAGAYSLFETGRDVKSAIDGVRDLADSDLQVPAIPDIPGVQVDLPETPVSDPPGPAPKGIEGESLVRRANLTRALRALRREQGGKALSLTVRPDRVDVQFVLGSGRIRVMQVTPGPQVRTVVTTGGGFGGVPATSLRGLDAGAPERLARAAARELGQPTARVDYVSFANLTGDPGWVAYFENGDYVVGDARGNAVRAHR